MFCPQCGVSQSDELKFCKSCGANLYAVRKAVTSRETDEKFDWNKTWVAEMLLSADEQKQRKQERGRSISPEEKRYNEIKAGIITSFVGIGLLISGLFVRKRLVEPARREIETKDTARALDSVRSKDELSLSSADWYETGSPKPSVTENTTRELGDSNRRQ